MSLPHLVTFANYGYLEFVKNFLINLDSVIKNHTLLFYCLDEKILEFVKQFPVKQLKVVVIPWFKGLSSEFENYETENYNRMMRAKTDILTHTLKEYPFIHFLDCDVACVKEPSAEYYEQYKGFDMVFQHDYHFVTATQPRNDPHIWGCAGNFTIRNGKGTQRLLKLWREAEERYPNENDQQCLGKLFQDLGSTDYRTLSFCKLGTYPYTEYTCGSWILYSMGDLKDCYFFHANFVIGSEAKKNLLKKAGLWFI